MTLKVVRAIAIHGKRQDDEVVGIMIQYLPLLWREREVQQV
jgi:hypothetical protein